jgi:hypothetical protein
MRHDKSRKLPKPRQQPTTPQEIDLLHTDKITLTDAQIKVIMPLTNQGHSQRQSGNRGLCVIELH